MSVYESENTITDILCENIIDDFEDISIDIYDIPKNNKTWDMVERILYRELLVKLNDYKTQMLCNMNSNSELLLLLNENLYTKYLSIQKIKPDEKSILKYHFVPNRYNVLTFIFYLNDVDGGNITISIGKTEKVIQPKMGKLVLFQEDIQYPYKCNSPLNKAQYIITGQLCYKNVL